MTIERADPDRIAVPDDAPAGTLERYIESDFRIRSGLCPNGCGLMAPLEDWGQECPKCNFSCNTLPELTRQ